jgi:hypothetical protein
MTEHQNETFEDGSLPSFVKSTVFKSCKFKGKLPSFLDCEFRDCDFSRCKFGELVECLLLSCNLDGADFSHATILFSKTNPVLPCTARGCNWIGVAAVMDCSFFGGIKTDESSAELFLIMASIPLSPLRKKIIRTFSDELTQKARKLLEKEFRQK